MKIKASFFGPIKRPWPEQTREVEIVEKTTIRVLLESFGYKVEDMRRVAVVINGKKQAWDTVLRENDDLRFVLMAGGG
ncbi:MAG: MoaD/ThiS family protein [Deltaproteobacteria bacterium]|nr:MoaD/ThiS family protein [Deltaproteobacteria bacterium]